MRAARERVTGGTDQNELFEVIVTGFEPRDDSPELRLQRVFGIDHAVAQKLLTRLPATVQRRVPRVRAEYFRRALLKIGASVEVRDSSGVVVEPHAEPASVPPPRQSSTPAAAAPLLAPLAQAAAAKPAAPDFGAFAGGSADTLVDLRPRPFATEVQLPPPSTPMPAPAVAQAVEVGMGRVNPTLLETAAPSPAVLAAAVAAAGAVPPASDPWKPPALEIDDEVFAKSERPPPSRFTGSDDEVAALRRPSLPSLVWDAVPAARAASGARASTPAPPAAARDPHAPITLDTDAPSASLELLSSFQPLGTDDALFDGPPPAGPPLRLVGEALTGSEAPPAAPRLASSAPPASPPPRAPSPAPPTPGGRERRRPARQDARQARQRGDASPKPAAMGAAERPVPQPSLRADRRSFWETLPEGLALPFTGVGAYWVVAIGIWSVAVAVLVVLCAFVPLMGAFVAFFANTSLLALACDYFRVCFWVPAVSEKRIDRSPDFDPARILNVYVKSGAHLTVFALVSQIPLIAFTIDMLGEGDTPIDLLTDPLTWLLALVPGYLWPAAVTMTALNNDFSAVWNLRAAVASIMRAPFEYTVAMLLGAATFVVTWAALLFFGSSLGVSGIVLSGTLGVPLAVSHGVLGALMGHLARARPEVFE